MRLMNADLLLQEALFVLITFKFFDVLHRGFEDGAFVLSDISYDIVIPKMRSPKDYDRGD